MSAEDIARRFHEAYERLAPSFGYYTRPASAVAWEQVPIPVYRIDGKSVEWCFVLEDKDPLAIPALAAYSRAASAAGYFDLASDLNRRIVELEARAGRAIEEPEGAE